MVTYSSLSKKLVFLPVYHCVYTFESKSYSFMVHGQTGQTVGERPYGFGTIGEAGKAGAETLSDFVHDKIHSLKK